MNWKRDRLAGTATDTVLVGTLVLVAFSVNRLRLSELAEGLHVPSWLGVVVILALVAGPVALYSPVERTLYRLFMRLLRPRLDLLQREAEKIHRSAAGIFRIEEVLEHLVDSLRNLSEQTRIAIFLPDEEEGALVMEAACGYVTADTGIARFSIEGQLARRLALHGNALELPLPSDLLGGIDGGMENLVGGGTEGVILPLRTANSLTGAVVLSPRPGERSDRLFIRAAGLLLDRLAVLIEDARLYSIAQRESLEKDLLFEVGRLISSALDRDTVLERILDGLQRVVGYDAAAIFTVHPDRDLIERHLVRGYEEEVVDRLQLKTGRGLVGRAAELREPILVNDVLNNPYYVNARDATRSELVFPVTVAGEVKAVINLASDRVEAYRRKDLRLLEVFGAQAGIAIQNAILYEEARQKRNLEQELALAADIQRALLPRTSPDLEGVEVATFFQPSLSLGGDLYDLVPLGDGRLGVAIGDISGKGTPAAILMASLYASFRSLTRGSLSLPDLMERLNNLLKENVGPGRYATFFYAVLDSAARQLRYSNAGHFPPLLLRADSEPMLLADGGIVLGYIPDSTYREGVIDLQPGDVVVLYTDGLVEAHNDAGEEFGEERIADIATTLIGHTASEVLEGLRAAVHHHCDGGLPEDDLTLVVLRLR